jgi:hypothetical protein
MQRIDEDTYIDDTLVTCAEYQLFIDEMHEMGEYYQPDHWTSYQFPDGQAQEPILGARHSDAVAFCKWLTQRESGEWTYRLPIKDEAAKFSLRPFEQSPLGYWIINHDDQSQFTWVKPILIDARRIKHILDLDIARALNTDTVRLRDLAHALDIDLVSIRKYARVLDLARTFDSALTSNLTPSLNVDHILSLDVDLAHTLDRNFAHHSSHDIDLDSHHSIKRADNSDFNQAFDRARILDRDSNLDLARLQALKSDLSLYINIFTFQERIAGRSPAFEGIRLVKERIR